MQRLLDPRWEAMAFFGGPRSAAPTSGLLDVPGWQAMALTDAANAVQGSNYPGYYAQWEAPATDVRQRQPGRRSPSRCPGAAAPVSRPVGQPAGQGEQQIRDRRERRGKRR